jgi:hypothetical protein
VGRGGLQQALKNLIDDARNRVVAKIGSEKEQAVARSLQTRGRRVLGWTRVEEAVTLPRRFLVEYARHRISPGYFVRPREVMGRCGLPLAPSARTNAPAYVTPASAPAPAATDSSQAADGLGSGGGVLSL